MNTEKDNHCIIVNLMGICSGPDERCKYYVEGEENCFYFCNQRCCHSLAMGTSTKQDRRSKERLKDLLKGM